jgi:hypothetical protein
MCYIISQRNFVNISLDKEYWILFYFMPLMRLLCRRSLTCRTSCLAVGVGEHFRKFLLYPLGVLDYVRFQVDSVSFNNNTRYLFSSEILKEWSLSHIRGICSFINCFKCNKMSLRELTMVIVLKLDLWTLFVHFLFKDCKNPNSGLGSINLITLICSE